MIESRDLCYLSQSLLVCALCMCGETTCCMCVVWESARRVVECDYVSVSMHALTSISGGLYNW